MLLRQRCSRGRVRLSLRMTQSPSAIIQIQSRSQTYDLGQNKQGETIDGSHHRKGFGGIQAFYDTKEDASMQKPFGREWSKSLLELKSTEDLHKLWFILLKETNKLKTMDAYNEKTERSPHNHIDRNSAVENSMKAVRRVLDSRTRLEERVLLSDYCGKEKTEFLMRARFFNRTRPLWENEHCRDYDKKYDKLVLEAQADKQKKLTEKAGKIHRTGETMFGVMQYSDVKTEPKPEVPEPKRPEWRRPPFRLGQRLGGRQISPHTHINDKGEVREIFHLPELDDGRIDEKSTVKRYKKLDDPEEEEEPKVKRQEIVRIAKIARKRKAKYE